MDIICALARRGKRNGMWITVIAACLLTCGFAARAQAGNSAASPDLAGIAHVAFRTGNLSDSLAFYEKLGFVRAFEFTKNGQPTEEFVKINDRQFVELYPQGNGEPIGLMHVCYESANLEGLHQAYADAGVDAPAVRKAGAGNLLFSMHGPDQTVIEFTQYMPESMHSKDHGMHLGQQRFSERLSGVVLPVQDVKAWTDLFESKLKFAPAKAANGTRSDLPGNSGESITFVPSAEHAAATVVFSVTSLEQAGRELRARSIAFERRGNELVVKDPDGNLIAFAQAH